jgi:hypothetical protein
VIRAVCLICIVLAFSSVALAGGRGQCRAEYAEIFSIRCSLEQSLISIGGFELAAGMDWRPLRHLEPVPYTVLIYVAETWWAALEVGNRWGATWFVSVAFGMRW